MEDLLFTFFTSIKFIAVLCGFVVAVLINLTGVGGGVMIIPALAIFFDMPPVAVVGTASLYITFTKFFSSAMHIYKKKVDWKVSCFFLLGAVPSSLFASFFIVNALKNENTGVSNVENIVHYAIIFFMIFACFNMVMSKSKTEYKSNKPSWLLLPSGLFAGIVMAVTGIGGGVLIIPMLNFVSNLSVKAMVSCSIVIAFVISTISGIVYSSEGHYNFYLLTSLLIGSTFGLYFSRFLENSFSETQLKFLVVAAVGVAAMVMLFSP